MAKMNRMSMLREYVQKNPECTVAAIAAATGINRYYLANKCALHVRWGAFTRNDRRPVGFTWNPDYVIRVAGRQRKNAEADAENGPRLVGFRAAARAEKRAGKRATKAGGGKPVRTMRELVAKHAAPEAVQERIAPVVSRVAHVDTTARAFAATIAWEDCEPAMRLAWQAHTEALALLGVV